VTNGDTDTLLSTRGSIDLALGARESTLRLHPDDDHCGMGHHREWLALSQQWLRDRVATVQAPV
jgi:esterase FrsA